MARRIGGNCQRRSPAGSAATIRRQRFAARCWRHGVLHRWPCKAGRGLPGAAVGRATRRRFRAGQYDGQTRDDGSRGERACLCIGRLAMGWWGVAWGKEREGKLGEKNADGRRSIYCKRQRLFTISGGGDEPEFARLRGEDAFASRIRVQRRVVMPWRTDHAAIPALLREGYGHRGTLKQSAPCAYGAI